MLVTKVNAIDTKMPSNSRLTTKTQYIPDKKDLGKKIEDVDKKIPNTSGLVKKTDYQLKITEIKIKYLTLLV